jgi:hypothetical protein
MPGAIQPGSSLMGSSSRLYHYKAVLGFQALVLFHPHPDVLIGIVGLLTDPKLSHTSKKENPT